MEQVAVLILVQGGVAEAYAPEFADVRILDIDNIKAGDKPLTLPDTPAWRHLAKRAGYQGELTFVKFARAHK